MKDRAVSTSFLVKSPFKYRVSTKNLKSKLQKYDYRPKISLQTCNISLLTLLNRLIEYDQSLIKSIFMVMHKTLFHIFFLYKRKKIAWVISNSYEQKTHKALEAPSIVKRSKQTLFKQRNWVQKNDEILQIRIT